MEFIDSTGHIFSLPSYEDNPINLEYVEGDYIFWLKDSSVSINNYYIKPVRFLLDEKIIKDSIDINDNNEILSSFSLEVSNSSQFYKLISPKYLQSQLEQSDNISKPIGLDKSQFVNKLTLDDFYFDIESANSEEDTNNLVVTSDKGNKFYMFPFYVVGYSDIEGTFLNNVMIKYSYGQDKVQTVSKELTRDEYYDSIIKQAISPIKVYQWDLVNEQYTNKRLVLTINPTYQREIIESNADINGGINKYEILYNGDGINDPDNQISDNIFSSLYSEDDQLQENQKNRIRSTISNGQNVIGQLPVEEYIYIYKLDHILPQGYYTFEGEILKSISYLPRTILPLPYMGFNHDGYRNSVDLDSLYPEDENKSDILQKFQCGTLEILNTDAKTNKGNYLDWKEDTLEYKGYQISDEEHLDPNNTPIEYPPIRDFWFMFISKEINEGKNGKTVDNYVTSITYHFYNYTPITVGCTFIDECEELIINGRNMGIRLPKEILKAIYNSSFYSKNADEKLLKNKLKELLLNYMNIKGETGNFKSMINSLKWFGWNNYINISQLIKTDNEFQNQFILDYFDIYNDIKDTFKYFNRTNNISLTVLENKEIGENYQQDYTNVFIGEGKPKLEDLFNKNVEVVKDDITFYKPYYNFIFNELALKLDCLKYYYQQYFLPVHININRASIDHKVYANTTKLSTIGYSTIVDKPVYLPDHADSINVIFPDTDRLIFMQSNHVIDDKFNEFSDYNDSNPNELYYVNENCVNIPIQIEDNSYEYVEDDNGIYYFNQGDYIKIEHFYIYNNAKYELVEDLKENFNNITHYSHILNYNIQPLNSITRYSKISKLYSPDEYGDYYRDVYGNYIKINYFYKMISEENGILSDRFNATHYSLVKNQDITKLDEIIRYSKISSGYFNCKLILTATIINKNPLGHYVKIGDKYLYKEKFYKNDFTNLEDLITYNDIDDSGNYIKMYDKFIRINSNDRYDVETVCLVNNDNFNFYQSPNEYYKNFVLIPRLLNNTLDYENAYFRLSLLVNDKWFNYDFRIVTPNVYLDLGRLDYNYSIKYSNDSNEYELHPFSQLKTLSSSDIEFNAFMFEPDLITINALFKEVDENDNSKVLTFLDKLLQMDNGEHEPDQRQMYEFYKKYYSNVLRVPYNTKYYNRIHVFDIYLKEWGGIDHIIKLEDYSLSIGQSWEEWSPYNGGQNNIIKGWRNYLGDLIREYLNLSIRFYRNDVPLEPLNIENLLNHYNMEYNGVDYHLPELNNSEGSINKFDIISLDNNDIIDTLCRYDGVAFQYLYTRNGVKVDHSYVNLYWYSINQLNTTQTNGTGKLEYDGNPKNIQLYRTFFNDGTSSKVNPKLNINESVDYDIYLMHDQVLPNRKAYWYLVLISKYPIASYPEMGLLDIHKSVYEIGNYKIVYADYSLDKFLVNRMTITKANGYNQFNKDDFIIVSVNNNDYQFNIDLNNKWSIQQMYDINQVYNINSNTNLMIIPNNNINNLYTPGYYNVRLQYTINGLNNILHNALAQYRVLDKYKEIMYPEIIEPVIEEEIFNINDIISDFSILYETEDGKRKITKDILEPELGFIPIGIKIMNKYYYGPQQDKSIFIGLKNLSISDPDNGWAGSGKQLNADIPYFGFYGIDIPTLKNFDKICYSNATHTQKITMGYPQTDYPLTNLVNTDGSWKYPADSRGRRGFWYDPSLPINTPTYVNINMLNDDDTLNWDVLDETCAASDWDGHANTLNIIEAFSQEFDGWKTIGIIPNEKYSNFSPMAACAWRYHTKTTNQGDWYVPSFAEVFFLSYNAKRLTDLFAKIASKYPRYCKPDLLTSLNIRNSYGADTALWTTTESGNNYVWEIHVAGHAHELSKTTVWASFPYIQIDD